MAFFSPFSLTPRRQTTAGAGDGGQTKRPHARLGKLAVAGLGGHGGRARVVGAPWTLAPHVLGLGSIEDLLGGLLGVDAARSPSSFFAQLLVLAVLRNLLGHESMNCHSLFVSCWSRHFVWNLWVNLELMAFPLHPQWLVLAMLWNLLVNGPELCRAPHYSWFAGFSDGLVAQVDGSCPVPRWPYMGGGIVPQSRSRNTDFSPSSSSATTLELRDDAVW